MAELNIKTYRDGERYVVVFENCKPDLERLIGGLLQGMTSQVQSQKISDVVPMKVNDPQMPEVAKAPKNTKQASGFEKSFEEFISAYSEYINNSKNMSAEQNENLIGYINQYAEFLRQRNVKEIPDEELIYIVNRGLQTVFANRLNRVLTELSLLKVEEIFTSGRQTLENAYKICVEKR